jgi:hypothetical protein
VTFEPLENLQLSERFGGIKAQVNGYPATHSGSNEFRWEQASKQRSDKVLKDSKTNLAAHA